MAWREGNSQTRNSNVHMWQLPSESLVPGKLLGVFFAAGRTLQKDAALVAVPLRFPTVLRPKASREWKVQRRVLGCSSPGRYRTPDSCMRMSPSLPELSGASGPRTVHAPETELQPTPASGLPSIISICLDNFVTPKVSNRPIVCGLSLVFWCDHDATLVILA